MLLIIKRAKKIVCDRCHHSDGKFRGDSEVCEKCRERDRRWRRKLVADLKAAAEWRRSQAG